jgi:hypothetical protein
MSNKIIDTHNYSDLIPSLRTLVANKGLPAAIDRFEMEDSVLRGGGMALSVELPEHEDIRAEFYSIQAQIAAIDAQRKADAEAEAARIAALPPPVPFQVTARQLFPVLRRVHSITPEMIEAAIGNPAVIPEADDRADALIEFRRAYIIERTNPLIALLAGVFALTETQIDDAFRAAATR